MPPASDDDKREFNPRWKGYVYILIASLVNFASLGGLEKDDNASYGGNFQVSLVFGVATFALTVLIILLDRFQYCCSKENSSDTFNYTKSMDGKIEGYTLLLFSLWWIVGVAHITQVGGVGYVANNIYFSAWMALFACVYTLNKWSAAKDILSIQELTGVSATLKSWYVLFLASLVTMGTCCDLLANVTDTHQSSAVFGIILGLGSSLISLFFIFVHYRIIDYEILQVGGWIELSGSFFMILLWIVCTAILTAEGGLAATIGGSGCTSYIAPIYGVTDPDWSENCYVIYVPDEEDSEDDSDDEDEETTTAPTLRPQVEDPNAPSNMPTAIASESPTVMTLSPTEAEIVSSMPGVNETPAPSTTTTNETANATVAPVDDDFILANDTLLGQSESEGFSLAPSSLIDAEDLEDFEATESPSDMGFNAWFNNDNTTNQVEAGGELETLEAPMEITEAPSDMEATEAPLFLDLDIGFLDIEVSNATTGTSNASAADDIMVNDGSNTTSNASVADAKKRFLQGQMDSNNTTTNTTFNATTINGSSPMPSISSSPTQLPSHFPSISSSPSQFPTAVPYTYRTSCSDVLAEQIPGSNLYLACWVCFFASLNITLRWKAAQAIQFAQAQSRKADEHLERVTGEELSNSDNDGVAAADDDHGVEDDDLR